MLNMNSVFKLVKVNELGIVTVKHTRSCVLDGYYTKFITTHIGMSHLKKVNENYKGS
jgi:hypothetical protein